MNNQLLAMQVFVRVVESGGFTRAADALEMPKATVTKLVQALENHLRVKLLNRTTRKVAVTPDGAAFYERATRLLGDLEDIESSITHSQGNPKGKLRVDCGGTLASLFVLPALPDFLARYPDIQVEFGVSDRFVDMVGENIDCVLRGGVLEESGLIARHVGDLPWVTAASTSYLKSRRKPAHPTDLEQGHSIVSFFSPGTNRHRPLVFENRGKRIEIDGPHRVAVNESNAYLAATLAGGGVGQMPAFMIDGVPKTEWQPLLETWQPAPMPVNILYPANRHLSTKVRVFVDWVAALFAANALAPRRP